MEFTWRATYLDGSVAETGSYDKIDRENLKWFEVLCDGNSRLKIHIQPHEKLFFRKRNDISPGNNGESRVIVGTRWAKCNKISNMIAICHSNGQVELSSEWMEGQGLFYPPKYRDFERIKSRTVTGEVNAT